MPSQTGYFAVAGQQRSFGDLVTAVERGTGRRDERRRRGTTDDPRAWTADRREEGEAIAARDGTSQRSMLTGQTRLDDPRNDRSPRSSR